VDLAAWWRARRWRALLELIEQLPPASRFQEAVHNDPEQARFIAMAREFGPDGDEDDEREPWAPPMSQYDLVAMLLREIAQNTAAAAGAKKPNYIPTPRTEVDRQVEILRMQHVVSIGSRYGFSPEDFGLNPSPR